MEKKLCKVQRWVERCLLACRSSSWENAVADMECAKAELDGAREELWAIVDGSRVEKRKKRISRSLGIAVAAVTFVLVASLPVSMPQPVVRAVKNSLAWEDEKSLLELVTPDERNLLKSLRENLSDFNLASMPHNPSGEPTREDIIRTQASLPEARSANRKAVINNAKKEVALDEVIQLIEIGHRALRRDDATLIIKND